jgi:hypothetical protein
MGATTGPNDRLDKVIAAIDAHVMASVRATHPAQSRGIPTFSRRPRKRQRRASAR